MKRISTVFLLSALLFLPAAFLQAQAIAPEKSARDAANSDARFIDTSIQFNQDIIFLSQTAVDRTKDERIKELAGEMVTDHSAMLYSMEQLKTAGAGSSAGKAGSQPNAQRLAVWVNAKLSSVSGANFDTAWVSGLLNMHQLRFDELTLAKESVTNPQLRMAISAALPLVKKHRNQLKTLQKEQIKMAIQKKKEAAAAEKKSK